MMSKKNVSTLKVAATYIGTVVGAGFATGQEILQFFSRFGKMGLLGLVIATILFMLFGYIIMDMGRKLHASSHLEIINHAGGRTLGKIIDILITFFLFSSFTAMIAGTGALLTQQFNLPGSLGNILMAVLTAFTVLTGINGVINSISFVVPFLLAAVIGTGIFSLISSPPMLETPLYIVPNNLVLNWFTATVLYVSYNTILSVSVLGPLGSKASSPNSLRNGAILGGLGLGLGAAMIYLSLAGNITQVMNLEVPMIFIAGNISLFVKSAYSIVLIAEIYTTAVGSLFGFTARVACSKNNPLKNKLVVAATTVTALLLSQFGFSNIVKYMYPVEGYGGMILLICLLIFFIKNK